MTIESLAQRIEHSADPDRYCTCIAACLERNSGDLEGALELAETIQMDELFSELPVDPDISDHLAAINALYGDYQNTDYAGLERQVGEIGAGLTVDQAKRLAAAFGIYSHSTSKKHALQQIHRKISERRESWRRIQFDEAFERFHPRHDDGKFREKSEALKRRHAKQRERERRRPERKPRDTGPKSSNRQAVEQAMQDPDLRQELMGIASRIGADIRSQFDPEDIVQGAMVRAAKEADNLELTDVHAWLQTLVARELKDTTKGARAFKRRGNRPHLSLDEELDHAERVGQTHGIDPAVVIGRAISRLSEADPQAGKLLSAYYGLRDDRQNFRFSDAQRQAAQRARAKIRPIIDEIFGKLPEPEAPRGTMEDVPGIPTGEYASGPKDKPSEAGMASRRAANWSVKPRKPPEHAAVEEFAKRLNLSDEQRHAIHNIVIDKDLTAIEQFDETAAQQHIETQNVDPVPDDIANLGASAAEAAMDRARATILDLLKKNWRGDPRLLTQIEAALKAVQPTIERILAESSLAGAVRGADDVLSSAPPPPGGWDFGAPNVPSGGKLLFPEGDEPIVRFPILEEAAERLAKASIIPPHEFYKLGADARTNAFTISGDLTRQSVEKIRDVLAQNAYAAPNAKDFLDTVEGLFEEGLPLSRAHLGQVFRNNVNGAWSDGHDRALKNPVVADAFPYRAYTATHDQRVRDEHIYMEQAGLSGTNVFAASDPVFETLRPPWDFNCRCSWHPMTIPQAAAKGVEHAQRWMARAKEQGLEPEQLPFAPEFVNWPTLNGERIMPPPQWQRSAVQFDAEQFFHDPRSLSSLGQPQPQMQTLGGMKPGRPNVTVGKQRPKPTQRPGAEPLPKVSGVKWGKSVGVAPLPHANRLAAEVDQLRKRYPRLAALPDITAKIYQQFPAERGPAAGWYLRGKRRILIGGVPGEIHRSVLPNPIPPGKAKSSNVTSRLRSMPEAQGHANRHEYGHHLWANASDDERNEWEALHHEYLPDLNVISGYGAGSPDESFAESFGLYTHPAYGKPQGEHLPQLPPQLEDYFRRILGQRRSAPARRPRPGHAK